MVCPIEHKGVKTGFLAVFIQHVEPSPVLCVLCVVCWIHIIAHKRSTANTVLLSLFSGNTDTFYNYLRLLRY